KVLLAMKHRTLLGNIHLKKLNEQIRAEGSGFHFPLANQPWNERVDALGNREPRRAGVSSFGVGGSNAHLVLEEWIEAQAAAPRVPSKDDAALIVLSARSQERLKAVARNLSECPMPDDLESIAYTLQAGRDAMSDRVAFV